MKNTFITILLGVLSYFQASAQNPLWIVAPKYMSPTGVRTLPTKPGGYTGQPADYASNAIADDQGNLRIFIVDGEIFDYQGNMIGVTHFSPAMTTHGRSEVAIVPNPGNCEQLYIFSVGRDYNNGNFEDVPSYTLLDLSDLTLTYSMEMPGPYPVMDDGGNAFISVSKKRPDNSHLIFISNRYSIKRYRLTASGITYLGAIGFPGERQTYVRSEMELFESSNPVADGYTFRIALSYAQAVNHNPTVFTMKLDANGAPIPGTEFSGDYTATLASIPFIHGLEFDKTGRYLFVTHAVNSLYPCAIDYIDFATNTLHNLAQTGNTNFQYSQIEFGKIFGVEGLYMINDTHIGRISITYNTTPTPDVITLSPTYYPQGVAPSYMGRFGVWAEYMDYKTFLLPDQIDGMDYNNFDYTYYDHFKFPSLSSPFPAPATAVWAPGSNPLRTGLENYVYIKEELRIPKGKTITINGMHIHFGPGARLIIENGDGTLQGGKLTLGDGTLLTSDDRCGNQMWHGVEVWGNASVIQGTTTSSQQGRLILSGSTITVGPKIENALNGAAARATNVSTGAVLTGYFGGIIEARNATFLNNQQDVLLANYTWLTTDNRSAFTNCSFLTTRLLNNSSLALGSHLSLTSVQGVRVAGCDFINSSPAFAINARGAGIGALNAGFSAYARCSGSTLPCTPDDPSNFTGLSFGITSLTFGGTLTFSSDGNNFTNNVVGIGSTATKNQIIVRNNFKVREVLSTNPLAPQSTGIYLTGATGYTVEENELSSFDDPAIVNTAANNYGIVIRNSGTANNRIYRNRFSNLKIGGQSESTNGTSIFSPTVTGLVWKCNTFNAPIYSYDLTLMDGTINYFQGMGVTTSISAARQNAANNRFSLNNESTLTEHDFYVNSASTSFSYVDYFNQAFYDLDAYTTSRISVTHAQAPTGTYITYGAEGCPVNYPPYGTVEMPLIEGNESAASGQGVKTDIEQEPNPMEALMMQTYEQSKTAETNHQALKALLFDTTLTDRNAQIRNLLTGKTDQVSQRTLVELSVSEGLSPDVQLLENPDFSENYLELVKIKQMLVQKGDWQTYLLNNVDQAIVSQLIKISEDKEDVLTAEEAKVILLLTKPLDLSFRFLENYDNASGSERESRKDKKSISIYPNPGKDKVTLDIDLDENQAASAKVYSMLGSEVTSWEIREDQKSFDINNFEKGVYLVKITDKNGTLIKTLRLVKN